MRSHPLNISGSHDSILETDRWIRRVNESSPQDVTKLLADWSRGDRAALETLMPLVYSELRRVAGHYLSQEKQGHTLSATALVHEAYLRLVTQKVPWQSRAHFFSVAAQMMQIGRAHV